METIRFIYAITELVGNGDSIISWSTPKPDMIRLQVAFEVDGRVKQSAVEECCAGASMEGLMYERCMADIKRYFDSGGNE